MVEGPAAQLNSTTVGTAVVSMLLASLVWYRRVTRLTRLRLTVGRIYALSEDILAAPNADQIRQRLDRGLDSLLQLHSVSLLLRANNSDDLDIAAGKPHSTASARRCLLSGEPLLEPSIVSLPMSFEGALSGVLQCGCTQPVRLQEDELAALRHLANQTAIALELLDRRRLRDQLLRSEKLGAVGQLISSIASELQPAMLRIQAGASSPAVAAEAAEAAATLEHLISFGRPERTRVEPFDLNRVASALAEFRSQPWRLQLVEFELNPAAEPLIVLGSPGQMEQALLSLIVHAEQALRDAPIKRLVLSTAAEEGRALIEIAFSASSASEEDATEGAWSLGVARGVVESHGGELHVTSNAQLSRFRILLPRSDSRHPATETAPPGSPSRQLTLLVVHRDPAALRALVSVLGDLNHRAVPASTGTEALDLATRLRFDALFAPHHLPEGSWQDFAPRARAHVSTVGLISMPSDVAVPGVATLQLPADEQQIARTLAILAEAT